MNWPRIKGKLFAASMVLRGKLIPSGSQAGEDNIIRYLLFSKLGIREPSFLDIGAQHPFIGNNTFYFYSRGCKGVCIEPDPSSYALIKKHRPRDTILHAGVGVTNQQAATLYIFPGKYSGWNTFLAEEAEMRVIESGIRFERTIQVPLININEVIAKHFNKCPNLISIDVEGLDLDILKSLDFNLYKPEVICVESITFSTNNKEQKIPGIAEFITSKGYFAFADTHINTIFCRTDAYQAWGAPHHKSKE